MGPLRALLGRRPRRETEAGPCSYLTLQPGALVEDRFGTTIGRVERVLTYEVSPYFDGIVVSTRAGSRFVDAPEVRTIERDVVRLSLTESDVEYRGPRTHGVHGVRLDRTTPSDGDRVAVVEALKRAYVDDRLSAHDLGDRIELAYRATSLDALEALIRDSSAPSAATPGSDRA